VIQIYVSSLSLLLFFFFFFYISGLGFKVQNMRAVLAMATKKLEIQKNPPGTREKAINPSLSGLGPTAHQTHQLRNTTPTR